MVVCPVENVSFFNVVDFLNRLSEQEGYETCYVKDGEKIEFSDLIVKGFDCRRKRNEYAARSAEKYRYSGSNNPDDVAHREQLQIPIL